jgi:NADH:ubiquinone oxidoreductase subunit F (NADH-binding)
VSPLTTTPRILPHRPVEKLEQYLDGGGGAGLEAARRLDPEVLIAEVEASGLRGRGGAGFPTGTKWRTVAAYEADTLRTTVVVNGAEGEPGTFKDRALLLTNPYLVLEGAAIAALAVGADQVVVAVKASDRPARDRLEVAVAEMRAAGLLDGLDVEVAEGPDEYLFGEETALLEVLAGRAPFPRIAPPYRRGVDEVVEEEPGRTDPDSGLSGDVVMAGPGDTGAPPTLVDNVETLAHVPPIIARGAGWFREAGTGDSPGTILCTVSGDVAHAGVAEIPLGTTVRAAIDTIGGGATGPVKAVLNGVSSPPLPGDALDTPLSYEGMAAAGSALGTASLIVYGEGTDMTAVAAGVARFLAVESCGQCTPCKEDGLRIAETLERLCGGEGVEQDLDGVTDALLTVGDGARCALAAQQQAVVGGIIERWGDELAARLVAGVDPIEPALVSEVRSLADGEVEVDVRRRDKQPDWSYDETWGGQHPVARWGDTK